MTFCNPLPEHSVRRLANVIVRTIHLVGIAGLFGNAMTGSYESVYFVLAIVSGVLLTVMEAWSGTIWFVQLRGVALYLKLLLLLPVHFYPHAAIPWLIAVIAVSGFMSHAPSWIRYYSVRHRQVVGSRDNIMG